MTDFENKLLRQLLHIKEKEAKEKYRESGNEGFKEIAEHAQELVVEITCSKRWEK